jgi:hypothetical protein
MNLTNLTSYHTVEYADPQTATCPYEAGNVNNCAAAIMTIATSSYQKTNYCWTDNYDCCPLFLSKVLRNR